jgi:acetyltransferase-like isoleucine patch superfamily enzyme
MPSEILFRSDDAFIHYERGDSDTLLIAFGHLGAVDTGELWAADLARGLGWSFMGIIPLTGTWYPASSFAGLPDSVVALCTSYRRRIAYGGSMGGFGAVKWAHLFGATMTISGSPQFSINPADVSAFDKRWATHFNPRLHADAAIKAEDITADNFVLADPYLHADWEQARAIAALSDRVYLLPVPNTAHGSLVGIASTSIFAGFVDLLERGDVAAAHRLMTKHRRRTNARVASIVEAAWLRRPNIARNLLARLEQGARPALLAQLYGQIAKIHEKRGEPAQALEFYNRANAKEASTAFAAAAERMAKALASQPIRDPLAILLDNLPDPNSGVPATPRNRPTPANPPSRGEFDKLRAPPASATEGMIQRATAASLGLPDNVFIDGEIEGNVVVVEPSDQHVELVIQLRGKGNTVIVRRDCALNAVLFAAEGAYIEIGEQTSMLGVRITAHEGARCVIGARCVFSNNIRIRPSDDHQIFDAEMKERLNPPRPIQIEDGVWIGDYVQISKGCVIGANSAVGAASLLDGDYPGNALIAGTPAKVIRMGIKWRPGQS